MFVFLLREDVGFAVLSVLRYVDMLEVNRDRKKGMEMNLKETKRIFRLNIHCFTCLAVGSLLVIVFDS